MIKPCIAGYNNLLVLCEFIRYLFFFRRSEMDIIQQIFLVGRKQIFVVSSIGHELLLLYVAFS